MTEGTAEGDWLDRRLDRFVRFNAAECNPAWRGSSLVVRYRPALLEGVLRLGSFIVKELSAPRRPAQGKAVLVAVGSQNNLRSAEASLGHRGDVEMVAFHNLELPEAGRIGLFGQYLSGLWVVALLPFLLWREKRPYVRRAMLARLDTLVLTMGLGGGIRRYLRRANPRVVVLMSALSCYHCVIIEQARRCGIATVFMTHAPVGRGQIALPVDFALLDGAYQQDLFPPSATRVFVTGSGRGSRLAANHRDRSAAAGVVVATNSLIRDLDEISAFMQALKERYPDAPLVIRPHPADRARFKIHAEIAAAVGARYHEPATPLTEGLDDVKFLISTQSGVIVDALLLGFYPLLLRSSALDGKLAALPADYYGFTELDLARDIELADPRLPLEWQADRNLALLEKAADPQWQTQAEIDRALDSIIAEA